MRCVVAFFLIFLFNFSAQAVENKNLFDALETAYQNNATLQAARMEYKVSQQQLDMAHSGMRPTISADGDITYSHTTTEGQSFVSSDGSNTSKSASVNLNQPVFRGGSTLADIKEAKNIITAQSLALSATEQNILHQVAIAYMDLLQSHAIVKLNQRNIDLVSRELERAEAGFQVGELTRTDVSQAKSRLSRAKADLITVQADLMKAKATYHRVVGEPFEGEPTYPPHGVYLPKTLPIAISLAESNNRNVLRSKFVTRAARNSVKSIQGELLPQVSAQSGIGRIYDQSDFIDEQDQFTLGLSASIPLYQGGATRTRVREAKILANQRYLEVIDAKQVAKEETIAAWENLKAAKAEIGARKSQVEAAKIAQEGVQYEVDVGERTILDKLNANQELLDAEVELTKAKRNEIVAQFALAEILGVLVPQKLGFSSINP